MKRTPTCTQPNRLSLRPWLAVVLLGMFLAVRGLVPAGFMPANVAAGSLYELCHGDSRSALLLNLMQPAVSPAAPALPDHHQHGHQHRGEAAPHTSGHDHSQATAQSFADNHCVFSATATAAAAAAPTLAVFPLIAAPAGPQRQRSVPLRPAFLTPPGRAPPAVS